MICVTGGYGFLGYHACKLLSEQGRRFTVIDSCTYAAVNVDRVRELPGFAGAVASTVVSPGSWETLATKLGVPSAILHFAAETHVDRSLGKIPTTLEDVDDLGAHYSSPGVFASTNVFGTIRAAQVATAWGIPLVHVSTDEVYGDAWDRVDVSFEKLPEWFEEWQLPASVEDDPRTGSSPYAASKVAAEAFLEAWGRSFGLDYRIVRPSNAYGPGQTSDKLIPVAIRKLSRGEPVPLYDGGYQVRQWIHASDFVEGVVAALDLGQRGGIYNLGGSDLLRNSDLVEKLAAVLGVDAVVTSVPDRPGHDVAYRIDSSRAGQLLEWEPKRTLESELPRFAFNYTK